VHTTFVILNRHKMMPQSELPSIPEMLELVPNNHSAQFDELVRAIDELVVNDFDKLVRILYRVDVNEAKLRHLLHTHPEADAGRIIGELLLEREVEKRKSRERFKDTDEQDGEERW